MLQRRLRRREDGDAVASSRQSEILIDELTADAVRSTGFDLRRSTKVREWFRIFL